MRCAGLPSRSGLGGDRNHGGADMAQAKTRVAFDVHTSGVVAAVLERESGELRVARLPAGSEAGTGVALGVPGAGGGAYGGGPAGVGVAGGGGGGGGVGAGLGPRGGSR